MRCPGPSGTATVKRGFVPLWGQSGKLGKSMSFCCRSISQKCPKAGKMTTGLSRHVRFVACDPVSNKLSNQRILVRAAFVSAWKQREKDKDQPMLSMALNTSFLWRRRCDLLFPQSRAPQWVLNYFLNCVTKTFLDITGPWKVDRHKWKQLLGRWQYWGEWAVPLIYFFREAKLHHLKSIFGDASCLHEVMGAANVLTQGQAISFLKILLWLSKNHFLSQK